MGMIEDRSKMIRKKKRTQLPWKPLNTTIAKEINISIENSTFDKKLTSVSSKHVLDDGHLVFI